jgi:anaerobic selenocysteine-containing dehydrogenase
MKVSRREFVKTAAVVSGIAALGWKADAKTLHTLVESPQAAAQPAEKLVRVFSAGSGCHHRCVLLTHVVDGKITKAEAAPFPEQPEAQHCCVRGLASAALPYYPNRLKYPFKRVGNRGEGKWQQITWDEALNTITQKMTEIRDKYGSQAILVGAGGSSVAPNSGMVNVGAMATRFANVFQATVSNGWTDDTGGEVSDFFMTGQDWDRSDARGMIHAKQIFIWGANPAESAMRDMKFVLMGKQNGATLVDIGPLFDATAAKADQWVPVASATDAALGLAMSQVIIAEGLYNADFVKKYTVGPLLVRDDNGLILREADVQSGGSKDRFAAWDEAKKQVVFSDKGKVDLPATVALTGTYTVGGVACHTAFQMFMDSLNKDYTPEQAAVVTKVPADTIRDLARRYAGTKPTFIYTNWGLGRYYNGHLPYRALTLLAMLCGYLGQLGGGVHIGGGAEDGRVALNKAPVQKPTDSSSKGMDFDKVIGAIRTGQPYPIKMWIYQYQNPIHGIPNSHTWLDTIPHLDFIVNINIRMDWSAEYADIVLPDATVFERSTLSAVQDHVVLTDAPIAPLFEARTETSLWSELGKRMGLGQYFQQTEEDYMRTMLDTKDPSIAGITLEKLRANGGLVRANVPQEPYVALSALRFDTPTGRIEFYSERLIQFKEQLPLYKPSLEVPPSPNNKYPMQFFTGRRRFYMQTNLGDIPVLHKFTPEPLLSINPTDAQARGINDGDWVQVLNDRGKVVLKAIISSVVPPGVVWTPHGPGPKEYKEGHYQLLTLAGYLPPAWNPVFDYRWQNTRAWWKWAGGQSDVIFDCAVQVSKVQAGGGV